MSALMPTPPTPNEEFQPVAPEIARENIDAAIHERLGEHWQRDWLVVHDAPFLVRLNKGEVNLDFQADLLGEVEMIEREANPVQLSGRLVAWLILGASLFVALAIAAISGLV